MKHSRTSSPIRCKRRFIALVCATLAAGSLMAPSPALAAASLDDLVLGAPARELGVSEAEMPDILATHAIIMRPDGCVYYERGADSPIKIASTTKIMTALVALDHCDPSEILSVDHAAATVGESCVGLKEGDTLTLQQALTGLMVMSGNDVATSIATHVGGKIDPSSPDPYGTFIKAMNDRAAQLGCTDTLFENPHGLDFGAWVGNLHSTAHDVARIWTEAWRNEAFRSFACSGATEMHVTSADGSARSLPLTVRNKILGRDGNLGGKTGSTYEAGECFVCTFSREPEGEVYIALFGSKGDEGRFNDTLTLANWYYGHFADLPLATSPKQVGGVPLAAEATCADWSDKLMDLTFADAEATARVFTLGGAIEQEVEVDELRGRHAAGTAAGSVTYAQGGKAIGSVDLTTADGLEPPNPLEWLAVQFDRLVRLFEGKPATAEERVYATMPDPLSIDGWDA